MAPRAPDAPIESAEVPAQFNAILLIDLISSLQHFLPSTTLRLRGPTIARAGAHERHVNIATYIKEIESSGAIT